MVRPTTPLEERLWAKIEKRGDDECWPWTGHTTNGYGYITVRLGEGQYTRRGAHCIVYELTHGEPIPKDSYVHQRCKNHLCCNPSHLVLGTPFGRRVGRKGVMHAMAKLTEEQVQEIRMLLAQHVQGKDIAKRFGVTPDTISLIKLNKRWTM